MMQKNILVHMEGLVESTRRAEELAKAYLGWATQSITHLGISCVIMIMALLIAMLIVRKIVIPCFNLITFRKTRLRLSLRRRFKDSIAPDRLNAMTAPGLLHEAVALWGGSPRSAKPEKNIGGEDIDGRPVNYPPIFYVIKPPRGVTGSVKTLFQVIAEHEPGWVVRPSRKGGRTEFFNSQIGYRV